MALAILAMLFLLRECVGNADELPLLSAHDLKILLAHVLPRRDADPEELLRQLVERHRQRHASIDSANRRRRRDEEKAAQAKVTK